MQSEGAAGAAGAGAGAGASRLSAPTASHVRSESPLCVFTTWPTGRLAPVTGASHESGANPEGKISGAALTASAAGATPAKKIPE